MEMCMRHGLIGGNAVFLPDGYTFGLEGFFDETSRSADARDERIGLMRSQIQDGLAVLNRHDQDMTLASLFACNQSGRDLISFNDGVRTSTTQVLTERTGVINR